MGFGITYETSGSPVAIKSRVMLVHTSLLRHIYDNWVKPHPSTPKPEFEFPTHGGNQWHEKRWDVLKKMAEYFFENNRYKDKDWQALNTVTLVMLPSILSQEIPSANAPQNATDATETPQNATDATDAAQTPSTLPRLASMVSNSIVSSLVDRTPMAETLNSSVDFS